MLININKPIGMTSHDVVDQVRRITGETKVGHAGTLDPFASGVLVVGVGREDTKKLGDITENSEKEYEATLELGKTSTTGDPEGEIQNTLRLRSGQAISKKQIEDVLQKFIGEIKQTSPLFSAVKVGGVRAYTLARQGKVVTMPKRIVNVFSIDLLDFQMPYVKLKITCSSGTYIRTLAEDIGKELNVGAYLTKLIRTRVGDYKIENSETLEQFSAL